MRTTCEVLQNGVTLVLAPSPSSVVTVAVHVAGGFRGEPEGCAGLAHLFEHLMFGGSGRYGRGEHFARVEGAGGRCAAHTRHDYTEFFDVAPAALLPLLLDLAVDRLRAPLLNEETLDVQRQVVLAEIATQHHGTPFGGFPWIRLPPVMHESWALTHDGYGDADALAAVTTAQCAEFFTGHYAPGRVVVVLEGGLGDLEATRDLACRSLRTLDARPAAARVDLLEADPPDDRHARRPFGNVPHPSCAVGLRLPEARDTPEYRGCTVLPHLLPGLLATAGVPGASVRCGWFGRPHDTADPDVLSVVAALAPRTPGAEVLDPVREVLEALAETSTPQPVLERLQATRRLAAHHQAQVPGARARRLGTLATLSGPTAVHGPRHDTPLEAGDVAAAAKALLARPAGTLVVTPGEEDT